MLGYLSVKCEHILLLDDQAAGIKFTANSGIGLPQWQDRLCTQHTLRSVAPKGSFLRGIVVSRLRMRGAIYPLPPSPSWPNA
jgi:hypothetical protein